MNDYSDLFYTMFSIVFFSFLLLQANGMILRNDSLTVDHEYEKTAIALAQSVIEEARTKAFDQALIDGIDEEDIPGGFRTENQFGPSGLDRNEFAVFDHYHGYDFGPVQTQLGEFEINVEVEYVDVVYVGNEATVSQSSDPTVSKRMTVTAGSVLNEHSATLVYTKTYFPR